MEEKQQWKQNPERSTRGLTTYTSADIQRTDIISALKEAKRTDQHVKVRRRPDGTFDVLVFDAV